MRKFRVNDYIELRLEQGKTQIYVGGRSFLKCKYVLLINPHERTEQWDIDSIDEAMNKLGQQLENRPPLDKWGRPRPLENPITPQDIGITPEEEFWAHCSNLQAWVENDYDTRIIHSNLAFPLLRELAKVSAPLAEFRLKEEIIKMLEREYQPTIEYLADMCYWLYLTEEEILTTRLKLDEVEAVYELERLIGKKLRIYYTEDAKDYDQFMLGYSSTKKEQFIYICDKHVLICDLIDCNLEEIPEVILKFPELKYLTLFINKIKEIPEFLKKMKNLDTLFLMNNEIETVPNWIDEVPSLRLLYVDGDPSKHEEIKKGKVTIIKY